MSSEPPLPTLYSALLDQQTLAALFLDLAATELLQVIVKGALPLRADTGELSLETARAEFEAGRAVGLQVRYRHAEAVWCDTLLRSAEGVKIVRMRLDPPCSEGER